MAFSFDIRSYLKHKTIKAQSGLFGQFCAKIFQLIRFFFVGFFVGEELGRDKVACGEFFFDFFKRLGGVFTAETKERGETGRREFFLIVRQKRA